MKRRIVLLLASLCMLPSLHAGEFAPSWPHAEWETSTPEAQGMDSAVLAQLVEYGRNARMDSLLVVRNGRIVVDAYYAPFAPGMRHRVNSVTKAFVGALAGIAIARGEFPGPGAPMADLVGGDTGARWPGMTLQHVLESTSGMEWKELLEPGASPVDVIAMGRSRNWKQFVLDKPLARPPGTAFNYNSGATHLLSALLSERTGMPTQAYAQQHLFAPLGITGYRWRTDPQGVATGGWGLYLAPRDMARFGLLYLRLGEWNGRQVLPRAWVQRVFDAKVPMVGVPGHEYADFWWTSQRLRAYMAMGYQGQSILVLPDEGIVAVTTSRSWYPPSDLIAALRRAVKGEAPLPANDVAHARLQALVAQFAQDPPPPPAVAGGRIPAGSRYAIADNRLGLQEVVLDLEGGAPSYTVGMRGPGGATVVKREVGLAGAFARGTHDGATVLNRGTWIAADTLLLEHHVPEELVALRYELKFEGDALQLTQVAPDGTRTVLTGRRAGP